MRENVCCLCCGGEMRFMKRERLQLGKTGWLLDDPKCPYCGAENTIL